MARVILFPYNMETVRSDRRIQERIEELRPDLDCIRVYPDRAYRPTPGDLIVGWGSGHYPNWSQAAARIPWLNKPDPVARCVNKVASLSLFEQSEANPVPFTTARARATAWALEGWRVMARNLTEGRDGEGAQILNTIDEVNASRAPLFTMMIPKEKEIRVHVFSDNVIGVQQRVQADDRVITDWNIRTSTNGWGLTRNWDVEVDGSVLTSAKNAVQCLGLHFGAVDIGIDRFGRHFVFEVNSAPEVMGPGVDRYARAILAQVAA